MRNEIDPTRQANYFEGLMRDIAGIHEDGKSFGTRTIDMQYISTGIIFDLAPMLPEHTIIIQERGPFDYENPLRRTVYIEFGFNKFKLKKFESPDDMKTEMGKELRILNQRKNPDPFTSEELRKSTLDPQTLLRFSQDAQKYYMANVRINHSERRLNPTEINLIISALTVLTDPPNLEQAEDILKPFFDRQF